MHFSPSPARAMSSLAAIALLLCGCSQPEVNPDPSLSVIEYERAGVPAPTGEWNTAEYTQATKALEALGARSPRSLPRAGSRRSGKVFGALVSGGALTTLFEE